MYYERLMKDYEIRKGGLKRTKDNITNYYINVIREKTGWELEEIEDDYGTITVYFGHDNFPGVIFIQIDVETMKVYDFDILGEIETDLNLEKIKELIER